MTPSPSGAPPGALARLAGAIVASLALHGVALEALTQLPRGWQSGQWSLGHAGTGRLRATLRAAAPGIESKHPEAQPTAPPPEASEMPRTREQPPAEQVPADQQSARVLAAPVYYPADQLEQRPLIKVHVEPAFPPGAPASRGRVVLSLYIGEQGDIEKIAIVAAEPPGAFEKSALDAFAAARFTPGFRNGAPVRSLVTIEVLFGAPAPPSSAAPRP